MANSVFMSQGSIITDGSHLFAPGLGMDATNKDTLLERDAANTLAQRNGTNAQGFRLYNTFTDASNYERLSIAATGGGYLIDSQAAGTGTTRNYTLGWGGAGKLNIGSASILASVAIGYSSGVGAGGTVTQATDKTTTVVLNTVTGEITMNGAALGADTTVSFTLTDSGIAAGDFVDVRHVSAGTAGAYNCTALAGGGSATVNVRNITPGSLSEAIVLKFMVFKSATS